jgi:hypothetical protein
MDAEDFSRAWTVVYRFIRRHIPEYSDIHIYLTENPRFSVAFQCAQGHEFFKFLAVGQDIRIMYHKRHFEFFADYFLPSFFGFNDTASTGLLNNVFLLLLTVVNKMMRKIDTGHFTFC